MYAIHLQGLLTVKKALHVPVFRRWRLRWERRELGTRTVHLDKTIPLRFTAWANLVRAGQTVRVFGDWAIHVQPVVVAGEEGGAFVALQVLWKGVGVPMTYQTVRLPGIDNGRSTLVTWRAEVWRGGKIDIEATLLWQPS